jgi:hypothetical protein
MGSGISVFTVNGGSGSGTYTTWSIIGISAQVPTGYHFTSWGSSGIGWVGSYTSANSSVQLYSDTCSVTAHWDINYYDVHFHAGVGGTISGNETQSIAYGGNSAYVTAVANAGYHTSLNGAMVTQMPIVEKLV